MEDALKILGLSQKEAKIYLALCKHDHALVHTIAKDSGIQRTTCYGILEQLIHKGVASEKTLNGVKYYSAISIEALKDSVEQEFIRFTKIIPRIQSLAIHHSHEPKLKFYTGLDAIKTLYNHTLTAKKEILGYVNPEYVLKEFYDFQYHEYIPRRVQKKIHFRGIYQENTRSPDLITQSASQYKSIRFLPEQELFINHEINIYNNRIMYIFFKQRQVYGAIIEDPDLIKTERCIFEIVWKYAGSKLSGSKQQGI